MEAQGRSFPKSSRLITKSDYSYVFNNARAIHCKLFTVLIKPGQTGKSRLGLVVAKKVSKRAVVRNRIKRIIRESFRCNQYEQEHYDIVVLAKPSAANSNNEKCYRELLSCWNKISK